MMSVSGPHKDGKTELCVRWRVGKWTPHKLDLDFKPCALCELIVLETGSSQDAVMLRWRRNSRWAEISLFNAATSGTPNGVTSFAPCCLFWGQLAVWEVTCLINPLKLKVLYKKSNSLRFMMLCLNLVPLETESWYHFNMLQSVSLMLSLPTNLTQT